MNRHDFPHVVMFAAEAFPYIKVGGLGDVVGALSKKLAKLGAKITVVIPAYKAIHHDRHGIRPYALVPGFDVPMGGGSVRAEIFHTQMPDSDVDVFLVGSPSYFLRDGVYDDPVRKEGYPDNMQRFIFFMKAGLELLERLGEPVDVIHCHDWQTGLIPGLLHTTHEHRSFFSQVGMLFTIHNVAYQGVFPREALYWAGIDSRFFYPLSPFEYWRKVSFLKVGIEFSDLINTVSETYAKEIQTGYEYGYGMEGTLRSRKEDLSGIVNGIDYEEWNPRTDPCIPAHFSMEDLSGKAICKSEALKHFSLPQSGQCVPLIGIVSRLADQKGFDLIQHAIHEIAGMDLQMVVLGTGQHRYQDMLRQITHSFPQKISVKIGFDNRLAHLIEAGCDMFLMPSKYEPCGLNQLYSLRYGTVPIVRATGGLADTVINYDFDADTGTGFSFPNYSASEMLIAIKRALIIFSDPQRWKALVIRDMSQDWSWERSAARYMELYERVRQKRRPGIGVSAVPEWVAGPKRPRRQRARGQPDAEAQRRGDAAN
ncbi:MAG TPA: glycogen synthase GlgA [Acidobacteriota bacterium]|nr:glycogen synthase GlgA [Acidobacteriota bacterium]